MSLIKLSKRYAATVTVPRLERRLERFNALTNDEFSSRSAWIINQHHVQDKRSCYRSASLLHYAFRQSRTNLQAGMEFGQKEFDILSDNSKSIVTQLKTGSLYAGYRDKFLLELSNSSEGDGSVTAISGDAAMMREIAAHGPITTGMHVPIDWPRWDCLDTPIQYQFPNGNDASFDGTFDGVFGGHHAFIIYGWDIDIKNGRFYWLCKNSWKMQQWFSIYFNQGLGVEERGCVAYPIATPNISAISTHTKMKQFVKDYDDAVQMETSYEKLYREEVTMGGDLGWKDVAPCIGARKDVPEYLQGGDFGWGPCTVSK